MSEMTSAMEVRSRTNAMSSSRIRPATDATPSGYILPCRTDDPPPGDAG